MRLNILELPEAAAASWPDKPAYVSETESLTWSELLREARCVGSFLAARVPPRTPVAVLLSHSVHAVAALLGIVAAGCFNVPLDPAQPAERAKKVFERAEPGFLLYDSAAEALLRDAGDLPFPSLPYAEAARTPIDPELLTARRNGASVLDPVQVFYTSGSTGIPKGVVHTHRSGRLRGVRTPESAMYRKFRGVMRMVLMRLLRKYSMNRLGNRKHSEGMRQTVQPRVMGGNRSKMALE